MYQGFMLNKIQDISCCSRVHKKYRHTCSKLAPWLHRDNTLECGSFVTVINTVDVVGVAAAVVAVHDRSKDEMNTFTMILLDTNS